MSYKNDGAAQKGDSVMGPVEGAIVRAKVISCDEESGSMVVQFRGPYEPNTARRNALPMHLRGPHFIQKKVDSHEFELVYRHEQVAVIPEEPCVFELKEKRTKRKK